MNYVRMYEHSQSIHVYKVYIQCMYVCINDLVQCHSCVVCKR